MAALVSHAMHRLPTSPPDAVYSSYVLRGEGSTRHGGDVTERTSSGGTGALSRSMRYADPWLYGSVRASGGLLLAPALVLCQCPEYLTGSRRSTSKKSPHLCKKCKGTRLPLSSVDSKFGTVRCYPTTQQISTGTPLRAGTVRVSTVSRPSILPSSDPYDLMRRSRLSVPETTSSTSPFKDGVTLLRASRETTKRSAGGSKSSSTKQDASFNSTSGRRSILECDVNPYELMSNEKLTESKEARQSKSPKNIALVGGQRIRVRQSLENHQDYEDVQAPKGCKSSTTEAPILQFSPAKSRRESSPIRIVSHPKKPVKDTVLPKTVLTSNQYKSILKKRGSSCNLDSSPYSDVDEIISTSSTRKKCSKFYIPVPLPLAPRKKVQFLDAGKSDSSEEEVKSSSEELSGGLNDLKDLRIQYQITEINKEEKLAGKDQEEVEVTEEDVFEDALENCDNTANGGKGSNVKIERKVYRSNSDRINNSHKDVYFYDTMALRTRKRSDSIITFSKKDLEKLDGITSRTRKISPVKQRPTSPPPPPPLPSSTEQKLVKVNEKLEHSEADSSYDDPVGESDLRKNAEERINDRSKEKGEFEHISIGTCRSDESEEKTSESSEMSDENINTCEDKRQTERIHILEGNENKLVTTTIKSAELPMPKYISHNHKISISSTSTISSDDSFNFLKNISDFENPPSVPPRKRSNIKQPSVNIVTLPEVSSTVKVESPVPDNSNRTVVQISSPTAVHKIQIKNEFPEYTGVSGTQNIPVFDSPQRKTSILINGDDCYSTVNVNDNVPLYQSSVVVNDEGSSIQINSKNSSKIYITGTFISLEDTSKVLTEVSQHLNELVSSEIISEQQTNNTEEKVEETKNRNEQNIQKNDPFKSTVTNQLEEPKEENPRNKSPSFSLPLSLNSSSSSDLLRELLRDPVEAVRHNLVPHVCGKSDVVRRQRDSKFPIHTSPLGKADSLLESPLKDTNIPTSVEDSFLRLRSYESIGDDVGSEDESSSQYEVMDQGSECYTDHSNRSSVTEEELANRTKFYELLSESGNIEVSEGDDHHYESIKVNNDPIYEEIEMPPPLPANPPPSTILDDLQLDKEYTTRSIFEGASKYDILSYLVDAKERGIVQEDGYTYTYPQNNNNDEEPKEPYNRVSHMSTVSDSSEDNSLIISGALIDEKATFQKPAEVERNDSGVGSETSKSSLSKYRSKPEIFVSCEDCDSPLESKMENEPLLCKKCIKKRSERKEIITEIVETEEKYSRDLQIILEEFYQPMLVAGLLTPDQLSAIFLNAEELLENSQALAERLRDAVEIALEQGDDDLLTVNIGKVFLEAAPMLHAFETYCVRQGTASLLLASLEKEKELLRIFLRVSQMENTMLRRMNLNSFLMVPVQRVTKYPLLLSRLYKVTPLHHETREQLREAQHKIELHLNHMNSETKDIPSKLWRRIGSHSGRRASTEMDLVNIKLRKIAVDVLEWNHEEARFILEGKLLFTQPTDNNWRKGRTIKLTPVNALLVINGKAPVNKPSTDKIDENGLVFSTRNSGVREAALLLVRDKNGRYSLLRDPLYLDRCVIAADPAWQSYFEVQELLNKDTFIFKAEDEEQTHVWYKKLQFHAQGMGAWRKRRNALANIMINGMGLR